MLNMSVTKKFYLAFGVLLALVVVTVGAVLTLALGVAESVRKVNASSELLIDVKGYRSELLSAEDALATLALTGDLSFRTTYEEAVDAVNAARADLDARLLASPNPGVDVAMAEVGDLFQTWNDGLAADMLDALRTPATVDLARHFGASQANRDIWEGIDHQFDAAAQQLYRTQRALTTGQATKLVALKSATAGGALAILFAAIALAAFLGRTIAQPLSRISKVTEQLGQRDWDVDIPQSKRGDEIGRMWRTLTQFRKEGIERQARAEAEAKKAEEELARARDVAAAVADFRGNAKRLVANLDAAGLGLGDAAQSLDGVSGDSQTYIGNVSSAAQSTESSVQSVASAIEEMSISVREISGQMQNASRMIKETSDASKLAVGKVESLREMSEKIHDVIGLINGIAGQINLLALNATIESARAGDAGKGFAVVAQQVKQLADQTAKATEEITKVIGEVGGQVNDVVGVMTTIGSSINEVNESSSAVAAAVEEQSAALDEISTNFAKVSSDTSTVASNVSGVEEKVSETRRVAGSVSELSVGLKESSSSLTSAIEAFIRRVQSDREDGPPIKRAA